MTIAETTFVLVDTETTSADPATADLLEVAAIHCDWMGRSFGQFHTLVRPTRPIPPEASGIHGLCDRDVVNAPDRATVERALLAFVADNAVIVTYNASFDAQVLANGPLFGTREASWLCAERLAHHLVPESVNHKLGTLRWMLGDDALVTGGLPAHRALADVFVLRYVFLRLLRKFSEATGAVLGTLETQALLDFARQPYELRSLPFGKHFGLPLGLVPDDYLRWLLSERGPADMRPDTRYTVERELERRKQVAA